MRWPLKPLNLQTTLSNVQVVMKCWLIVRRTIFSNDYLTFTARVREEVTTVKAEQLCITKMCEKGEMLIIAVVCFMLYQC
jgi:hypothetical protein